MPTAAEYQAAIQRLDWDGLRGLWERIEARSTAPEWAAGKAFEYLVLRAFELDRAEVTWPYTVHQDGKELEQIDGAVYIKELSFLVESKDFGSDNVAIGPIAKLRNQLDRRPLATFGVVFSRTGFTDAALLLVQYSSPKNVLLWNGQEVKHAIENRYIGDFMIFKYRRCLEYAVPDFDIRSGELT